MMKIDLLCEVEVCPSPGRPSKLRDGAAEAASLQSYFKIPCGRRRWNPTLRTERARMGHPAAEYPYSSARIGLALDVVPQRLKPSEFDVWIAAVNRCAAQRQGQYTSNVKIPGFMLTWNPTLRKERARMGHPDVPFKATSKSGSRSESKAADRNVRSTRVVGEYLDASLGVSDV